MHCRPHRWNNLWRNFGILLISMWVGGCTTLGSPPRSAPWNCDREADAAVERGDWDQALIGHQLLLKKDPGNCLAIYHLGYIHGKLGDRNEEVVRYELAVRCGLNRDDRLFFNLGMAYGDMNLTAEALSAFDRAVALNPSNADNYFGLGLTAQAAGRTDRARLALIKAIDLAPRHWEARILLTRIDLDHGQLESAQSNLAVLLQHLPENEAVQELQQSYMDRRITSYDQ